MDKNKVRPLELNKLKRSDNLYDYYQRNYKFSSISGYGYNKVPILESASNFISHEHLQYTDNIKLKYPHKSYIEGFIDEYSQPLSGDLETDEGREWILLDVQPNPWLPTISYRYPLPDRKQEKYFDEEKAEEYGVYNAKAFKAWKFIINHLPYFEKIICTSEILRTGLAPKEGLTPDHFRKLYLYLIDDKRKWIEERENSERDFLAIFSTDTLPNGWNPVKWLLQTKLGNPHQQVLLDIMHRCCKDSAQSYPFADRVFSYFISSSGTLEKGKYKKYTKEQRIKGFKDIENLLKQ